MSIRHTRTERLVRGLLVFTAIVNLGLFLSGLMIGIFTDNLLALSLVLCCIGILGMFAFAACWIARPQVSARMRASRSRKRRRAEIEKIDPVGAENVMRNIRGIPFLIQAIQYSMEASYYRDLMSEMGEGVVRTSVIHTAPACTSVLDDESDDEQKHCLRATPRHSGAEEQWLPAGERWQNEQLRLSLEGPPTCPTTLLVFPFRESTPRSERSVDSSTLELDRTGVEGGGKRTAVRCIGMSAAFLTRLGSGIGSIDCPQGAVV